MTRRSLQRRNLSQRRRLRYSLTLSFSVAELGHRVQHFVRDLSVSLGGEELVERGRLRVCFWDEGFGIVVGFDEVLSQEAEVGVT
jgi:hypothetical protein